VNLAIKGLYWARNPREGASRPRILVPGGEHHATLDTVEWLGQHDNARIEWLPVDDLGRIDLAALERSITADPQSVALVTLLAANNEVGTLQPVAEVAALAAAHHIPVHVDAISAYGHVPLDFDGLRRAGVTALSVSAHKIGGPVGIAALVLSRTATVVPLLHGGGQQRQVRSGTQDVAAAVSFAVAASVATAQLVSESERLGALRDRLVAGVRDLVPDAVLNGDASRAGRLPGNAHFTFPGCEGDSLLFLLDAAGVSVSTGSACQAGIPEPSHVLRAMGRSEAEARGALRITLGRTSTDVDVDVFLAALPAAYAQASRAGFADRAPGLSRA
jgi:cysteine desulfurase